MDKHEHLSYRSGKSVMAAGLAVMLLICPSLLSASGHSDCKLPDKIALGNSGNMLLFEKSGKGEPMLLDEIDIFTKGKWFLWLWTPRLWSGEVGIYLYPWNQSAFLVTYKDVDTTNVVQFFAACKAGKQYATIPGTFMKPGDWDVENWNAMKNWSGYLGMTLAPEGTEPVLTLKGDLTEFGISEEIRRSVGSRNRDQTRRKIYAQGKEEGALPQNLWVEDKNDDSFSHW